MTGVKLACHSMPMYHGMGIAQTGWSVSILTMLEIPVAECSIAQATAGLVVTAFKPQVPAVAPTPDLVLQSAIDSMSDIIFCVPSFVEVRYTYCQTDQGMLIEIYSGMGEELRVREVVAEDEGRGAYIYG